MERVHYLPGEVDVSGVSPETAQVFRDRRLPFDEEDPFIFHVLTTLDEFDDGEAQLMTAMSKGAALMPASQVEFKWGSGKGKFFARDVAAGDADYLFMTPCNVYSHHDDKAKHAPAVAFRLSYVLQQAQIAFRVHDLEPPYMRAEQLAGEAPPEWFDDEDDPYWDEAKAMVLGEEYAADAVREQIEGIAECGTQYDPDKAVALVRLYAEMCGAFRRENRNGQVPRNDPERVAIYEASLSLFPDCILSLDLETEHWSDDLLVREIVDGLKGDWESLFGAPESVLWPFPNLLLHQSSLERPELMVKGPLELCEAAFFRNSQGAWRPVPADVCMAGRGV